MVSDEVADLIEHDAHKHRLSKSEVARTYIDAGIEAATKAATKSSKSTH